MPPFLFAFLMAIACCQYLQKQNKMAIAANAASYAGTLREKHPMFFGLITCI